jgi:hypothetical protein
MIFELYTDVALACDVPRYRLRRGDMVRLVDHHLSLAGEEGYSAEVLGAKGQTLAVVALTAELLEPLEDDEVLSARSMSRAYPVA